MRTLCDVCESAAAILFCAADEAALCRACDDKVHMCNKLASRHVRVELTDPIDVPRCDICENSPGFFYCEMDGSSLCLQCDMIVHVGGKRTHRRYLLLRQRVESPREELHGKPSTSAENKKGHSHSAKVFVEDNRQKRDMISRPADLEDNVDRPSKMKSGLIDLNTKPQRLHCDESKDQVG